MQKNILPYLRASGIIWLIFFAIIIISCAILGGTEDISIRRILYSASLVHIFAGNFLFHGMCAVVAVLYELQKKRIHAKLFAILPYIVMIALFFLYKRYLTMDSMLANAYGGFYLFLAESLLAIPLFQYVYAKKKFSDLKSISWAVSPVVVSVSLFMAAQLLIAFSSGNEIKYKEATESTPISQEKLHEGEKFLHEYMKKNGEGYAVGSKEYIAYLKAFSLEGSTIQSFSSETRKSTKKHYDTEERFDEARSSPHYYIMRDYAEFYIHKEGADKFQK